MTDGGSYVVCYNFSWRRYCINYSDIVYLNNLLIDKVSFIFRGHWTFGAYNDTQNLQTIITKKTKGVTGHEKKESDIFYMWLSGESIAKSPKLFFFIARSFGSETIKERGKFYFRCWWQSARACIFCWTQREGMISGENQCNMICRGLLVKSKTPHSFLIHSFHSQKAQHEDIFGSVASCIGRFCCYCGIPQPWIQTWR